MRLRLYCNRYGHFKDALVCSVNCIYRTRCHDFALFYDANRVAVDELVADYYAARRKEKPAAEESAQLPPLVTPVELGALIRLEVKREMADTVFIWVDKEDRAELLETKEVIRRAERGQKAKHIYKVSQEMELRYQLVPRKSIDRAKRVAAVEEERTTARQRARAQKSSANAPVPFPAPVPATQEEEFEPAPAARRQGRTRSRVAKIAGR